MQVKTLFILCFFLLSKSICFAEESPLDSLPDADLLEFLGTWEDRRGEWVDPLLFDERFSIDEALSVEESQSLLLEEVTDMGQVDTEIKREQTNE